MDKGSGVLAEHRDIRNLLDRHQLGRQALGQRMGTGEGPVGGVDIDHRHRRFSFVWWVRARAELGTDGIPNDSAGGRESRGSAEGCRAHRLGGALDQACYIVWMRN